MPSDLAVPTESLRTRVSAPGLWGVRVLIGVTLLSLILAETVCRSPSSHDFCIGFGIGALGAALLGSFLFRRYTTSSAQPSDVDSLPITR